MQKNVNVALHYINFWETCFSMINNIYHTQADMHYTSNRIYLEKKNIAAYLRMYKSPEKPHTTGSIVIL